MGELFTVPEVKANIRIKIRRLPVSKDSISDLYSPCKKTNIPLTDPNKPTQLMSTLGSIYHLLVTQSRFVSCPLSFIEGI